MSTVSVRLEKTNACIAAHDFRRKTPDYVNQSYSKNNVVLLGEYHSARDVKSRIENEHLKKTGRARRKDSKIFYAGIITFGRHANLDDKKMLDECAINTVNEIARKFNFSRALWLVRHEDETRSHYHFAFANANRETSKPVRMSKNDMRAVQDIAGRFFSAMRIFRGKPKKQRILEGDDMSKIVHRSVAQLHADLPADIQKLKPKPRRRKKTVFGKSETYYTETDLDNALRVAMHKRDERIAELEHENENLKTRITRLQRENLKTRVELQKYEKQREIARTDKLSSVRAHDVELHDDDQNAPRIT